MPITIIKLSELPFGAEIEISGHLCRFAGYEKRKTNFGNIEHFVFKSDPDKNGKVLEKTFPRFKFSTTKIKCNDGKFKW